MKGRICLKLLSICLASSIILASNIKVQADTNICDLDFNNNWVIDTADLNILATKYNLKIGDSKWNSKYDLNLDNVVDVFDLVKMSKLIGIITIVDSTDITSYFTDANFKTEVYTLVGKTSPAPILYSDVKNISYVNVSSKNISSLKGIEYFKVLTYLSCASNKLTSLDVSKNTSLTSLSCRGSYDGSSNQLTTLNISNNTKLIDLDCSYNQLKTLNVSKNTALANLSCYYNQLATLDVIKNLALTSLACGSNKLTILDLSKNTKLTDLNCSYNQLTTLYSTKDTWGTSYYKTQYTDSTQKTTTDGLVITIKN